MIADSGEFIIAKDEYRETNLEKTSSDNLMTFFEAPSKFVNTIAMNAYPSVDTFFFISGLLVGYVFFKVVLSWTILIGRVQRIANDPNLVYRPMTWVMYVLRRWLRLTPAYGLFIAFFIAWAPQIHEVWSSSSGFEEDCAKETRLVFRN